MKFKDYLYAWLVPGLAYFLKGARLRGMLLFVVISGVFVSGLLMGGGVFSRSGDFVSVISSIARAGAGLPWFIGLLPGLRFTDMVSGEIGACFATVAGLLNILTVMSLPDFKGGGE
jgi:hypothetical protein